MPSSSNSLTPSAKAFIPSTSCQYALPSLPPAADTWLSAVFSCEEPSAAVPIAVSNCVSPSVRPWLPCESAVTPVFICSMPCASCSSESCTVDRPCAYSPITPSAPCISCIVADKASSCAGSSVLRSGISISGTSSLASLMLPYRASSSVCMPASVSARRSSRLISISSASTLISGRSPVLAAISPRISSISCDLTAPICSSVSPSPSSAPLCRMRCSAASFAPSAVALAACSAASWTASAAAFCAASCACSRACSLAASSSDCARSSACPVRSGAGFSSTAVLRPSVFST